MKAIMSLAQLLGRIIVISEVKYVVCDVMNTFRCYSLCCLDINGRHRPVYVEKDRLNAAATP